MAAEKNLDSLSKLRKVKDGQIKRVDGYKVLLSEINIEAGFNARGAFLEREEYWESPEVLEYIDGLAVAYAEAAKPGPSANKPKIDPIRVVVRDGKIFVSDGEHRFYGLHRANDVYGAGIEWVDVIEGEGEQTERNFSRVTSNEKRQLSAIERAVVYRDAVNDGWSVEKIAQRVGKSVPHVYKLLTAINKWGEPLLVQVQKGEISFTEAQSQYEATRRKVKKDPDPSNLEPLDENESGTNLPTDSGASGTDLPTNGDNSNAGTDTGKTDKRDSGKSKTKGLSKAIADSLVSLVFGFEAKKTDSGYTLELSEEQYKAILMLQEQVESELKGK
ncbi:hypothetical protein FPM62_22680 [Salmonella enterica]|nr:hypothetical protein [Salmonella enterica]